MVLPKIDVSDSSGSADAVVLAWSQETPEQKDRANLPQLRYLGKRQKAVDALAELLGKSKHFFAKKNETSLLRFYPFGAFPSVLLLGLGPSSKWSTEVCRQCGAAVFVAQRKERLGRLSISAESLFSLVPPKDLPLWYQAFCEGYWLASYEYDDLKKEEAHPFVAEGLELAGYDSEGLRAVVKKASALSKAVNFARSLGDRPGNVLTPTELSKLVAKMAKEKRVQCTVWGRTEIQKEKMGLFLGVAKGSAEEPKFIILEHKKGKKGDRPIVLVGKGITFDSGGISLKPAARMEDMKYDMMGAAAVAGIFQAVGERALPINLVGLIPTCENMPGGRAQKPGDVARSRSGKTVEIINTDAEGRLILADALEYAQTYEPQAIIDFATLTGAVVDALGTVASGVMGNEPALIDRIKGASAITSERVWELPLYEEYEDDLKSAYADIKNSGVREAGSSKGGTFLKFFIDPKYSWAHCDIAGSAYHRKDLNYAPQKFAAGVMVRLIFQMLEDWKPLK